MRAKIVVVALLCILVISSAASAKKIPEKLPMLNGDRVHTLYADGSWQPPSSINWVFPDAVEMQGGEYAFKEEPELPGEIRTLYWIEAFASGKGGSLRLGNGSLGLGYSKIKVHVRAKQYRMVKRNGRLHPDFLWSGEAEGDSAAVPYRAYNVKVGQYDGQDIGVSLGGGDKSPRELLAKALENALFNLIDQAQRRISDNEPIVVTEIKDGSVVISAGALRGIKRDQTYAVYPPDQLRRNPATGRVKSQSTDNVAFVHVVSVSETTDEAYCEVVEGTGTIQSIKVGYRCELKPLPSEEAPNL